MAEKNKNTAAPETKKFRAEVRQVLDIVIHSLYTHREIFIRELVSNASDALEKMRHESLVSDSHADKDAPLEIRIDTDEDAHTITITDTGVGMTREELEENLGTIARSGTREFLENLKNRENLDADMIGKFGVGFYSAFMAGDRVRVRTRSFRPQASGYEWSSDGMGEYTIEKVDGLPRGTSVIVELKEDAREYEKKATVESVIRKYSNFVPFPIKVDGETVNTVQAIWLKSPSDVKDEEYDEFYKFIANAVDEPLSRLHLTADAPIQLSALLYVPSTNVESFGFMKMKPGVNLYSRKVLIQEHSEKLLPEYMRFVTGVVDSADLPLNISRETLQDNMVFRKMGKYLTRRVIRHLEDLAKNDPDTYATVWDRFGMFVKEGISSDFENRADLAKLLRFHSSAEDGDTPVSLDDYAARMREGQSDIYYLNGPTRESIEQGPYVGAFKARNIEVLYLHEPIDDFVMMNLGEYDGRKLVSADAADIELPDAPEDEAKDDRKEHISGAELASFTTWMKETIGDTVKEVRESKRLTDRPAMIVNPDSTVTTTMKRVMKAAGQDFGGPGEKILEINTSHPLIVTLKKLRDGSADKGFLQLCARQIHDNALAEAGLLDNPRTMVDRVYDIMERALGSEGGGS